MTTGPTGGSGINFCKTLKRTLRIDKIGSTSRLVETATLQLGHAHDMMKTFNQFHQNSFNGDWITRVCACTSDSERSTITSFTHVHWTRTRTCVNVKLWMQPLSENWQYFMCENTNLCDRRWNVRWRIPQQFTKLLPRHFWPVTTAMAFTSLTIFFAWENKAFTCSKVTADEERGDFITGFERFS